MEAAAVTISLAFIYDHLPKTPMGRFRLLAEEIETC
jgi:hypothetical protein